MARVFAGYDYTLPVKEFQRVYESLYKLVGGCEEVEIINVKPNGRIRIRFPNCDAPPASLELDDILRDTVRIKGLRRAPYFLPDKGF